MGYHELAELTPALVDEATLVQLTNDAVDGTDVVPAVWEYARERADALIDGYLGTRYQLPLASVPVIVRELSLSLTVYHLYARRFAGEMPTRVTEDKRAAEKTLKLLADGTVTLGVQPVMANNTERTARVSPHTKVFGRDKLTGF